MAYALAGFRVEFILSVRKGRNDGNNHRLAGVIEGFSLGAAGKGDA